MWRYLNTAFIIAHIALPCFGQWSSFVTNNWTNGAYFSVEDIASQCYSASVERCLAVSVTPDEPSFWDYLTGKNRAKLLSVKRNIVNSWARYVKPQTNYPGWAYWPTGNNDFQSFLFDIGVPSNTISETPYFKTQYYGVTGGWQSVMICLTNLNTTIYYLNSTLEYDQEWQYRGIGRSTNSYSEALSFALSDYSFISSAWYGGGEAVLNYYIYNGAFEVLLERLASTRIFTGKATSYPGSLITCGRDVKVWADVKPLDDFNGHYDFTNSGPQIITNLPAQNGEFTLLLGNTNKFFDGSTIYQTNSPAWGYYYEDVHIIENWSTATNGFTYK